MRAGETTARCLSAHIECTYMTCVNAVSEWRVHAGERIAVAACEGYMRVFPFNVTASA